MNLPSVDSLRCFCAAAKFLNFRAAARAVALTPAAFGQRIKQLEDQLGAQLFVRTTRSVRLSAAGLSLVPVAQRASYRIHRVKPGESLSEIAQTYKTSLKTLLAQNNSYSMDSVAEGDMLIVPASKEVPVRRAVRRKSSASSRTSAKAKAKAGARPAVQRGAVQRGSGRANAR